MPFARLITSSLCAIPRKCDRACTLELNSRLQISQRGFSRFAERLSVDEVFTAVALHLAFVVYALGAEACSVVNCEPMMNWRCWLQERFCSNDWNTANKLPTMHAPTRRNKLITEHLKGSVKEQNISIYFFFLPIIQWCSMSDVLFTGGREVSDFNVLKYY